MLQHVLQLFTNIISFDVPEYTSKYTECPESVPQTAHSSSTSQRDKETRDTFLHGRRRRLCTCEREYEMSAY